MIILDEKYLIIPLHICICNLCFSILINAKLTNKRDISDVFKHHRSRRWRIDCITERDVTALVQNQLMVRSSHGVHRVDCWSKHRKYIVSLLLVIRVSFSGCRTMVRCLKLVLRLKFKIPADIFERYIHVYVNAFLFPLSLC